MGWSGKRWLLGPGRQLQWAPALEQSWHRGTVQRGPALRVGLERAQQAQSEVEERCAGRGWGLAVAMMCFKSLIYSLGRVRSERRTLMRAEACRAEESLWRGAILYVPASLSGEAGS